MSSIAKSIFNDAIPFGSGITGDAKKNAKTRRKRKSIAAALEKTNTRLVNEQGRSLLSGGNTSPFAGRSESTLLG